MNRPVNQRVDKPVEVPEPGARTRPHSFREWLSQFFKDYVPNKIIRQFLPNVVKEVWDFIRPHPIDSFNAVKEQWRIMTDPRQPPLNRVGGGFGVVGHTILGVTDWIPLGSGLKKLGERGVEKLGEALAEREAR